MPCLAFCTFATCEIKPESLTAYCHRTCGISYRIDREFVYFRIGCIGCCQLLIALVVSSCLSLRLHAGFSQCAPRV